MQTAPLNIFQKLVRRWDSLHPYNAAQIFHLRGSPNESALTDAWNRTLFDLQLGPQTSLISVTEPIEQWISSQMNLRFDSSEASPFRPFLLKLADSYYAGVVYHHWVADSASIRLLMREWFFRMFDPARIRRSPLPIARRGYWHYFGPDAARWQLGSALAASLRWSSRFRRVRRVESAAIHDFTMRFSLHHFDHDAIDSIRAAARRSGATVNDWFLAAMAQVCSESVVAPPNARREDLALGTIVDLRARSPNQLGDAFGLFLGFTSVIIRPHELHDFPTLVQAIARQTRLHKADSVPESSMIRITAGVIADKLFRHDPRKLVDFYRKRFPLAGGISNVNLNKTWVEEYHPDPLIDYIRVSPTGPMMPVVFTTTTLGHELNFGLSTRDSIVPPDRAATMAEKFKSILQTNTRDQNPRPILREREG